MWKHYKHDKKLKISNQKLKDKSEPEWTSIKMSLPANEKASFFELPMLVWYIGERMV